MKFIDLTGRQFDKLTVESLAGRVGVKLVWNCVCECGNHAVVRGESLRSQLSTSCGHCPNQIVHFGDDIIILLEHNGGQKACFIDAKDYPLVKDYRWCAKKDGNTFYAHACVRGVYPRKEKVTIHVLLVGKGVDHRDNDGLNNTRENLRLASVGDNNRNVGVRADNTSGHKGVSRRGSRFRAVIVVQSKKHHLGTFDTALEAARAYNVAARKLHGVFAQLNDVEVTCCIGS